MLPKYLLIAMFFAVCIHMSIGYLEIVECTDDLDCYKKLMSKKLYIGVIPILVTKTKKHKAKNKEIIRFFNEKKEVTTMLKVIVDKSKCKLTAKYLNYINPDRLVYPFVAAMNNNRVINVTVKKIDRAALELILRRAINPAGENDYIPQYGCFTDDLMARMEEERKKERRKLEERSASVKVPSESEYLTPDVGGYVMHADMFDLSLGSLNNKMPAAESSTAAAAQEASSSRRRHNRRKRNKDRKDEK